MIPVKPRHLRMPQLYKDTKDFQTILYKHGICWHNTFAGEHGPLCACCSRIDTEGRWRFLDAGNTLIGGTAGELENPYLVRKRMVEYLDQMIDNDQLVSVEVWELVIIARIRRILDILSHQGAATRRRLQQSASDMRTGAWWTMN